MQEHQELSAGQRSFLRMSDLSRKIGQREEDVTAAELLGSCIKYCQMQSSIMKQLILNQLVCNQWDLLNSSCSDEKEWQRNISSLIHLFQHFHLLTSNLPENTLQIIKAHL